MSPICQVMNDKGVLLPHPFLEMIEAICIAWFTLEYIVRLLGAPAKCEFLKNGMNIVDVLSILPFFIELFMAEEELNVDNRYSIYTIFLDIFYNLSLGSGGWHHHHGHLVRERHHGDPHHECGG